jgi:hypothetical protein
MLREIALFEDEGCKSLTEDPHGLRIWIGAMRRRIERLRDASVQVEADMALGELRQEAEAQNSRFRTTDGE